MSKPIISADSVSARYQRLVTHQPVPETDTLSTMETGLPVTSLLLTVTGLLITNSNGLVMPLPEVTDKKVTVW